MEAYEHRLPKDHPLRSLFSLGAPHARARVCTIKTLSKMIDLTIDKHLRGHERCTHDAVEQRYHSAQEPQVVKHPSGSITIRGQRIDACKLLTMLAGMLVSRIFARWNQLDKWLRRIEGLRREPWMRLESVQGESNSAEVVVRAIWRAFGSSWRLASQTSLFRKVRSVSPLVRLNVLELAGVVANGIELLASRTAMSGASGSCHARSFRRLLAQPQA